MTIDVAKEELRRLRSPEQRRAQIREAALTMFLVKGFHQTTMRDIAGVFGMSVGHLYNYYRNKDAIVEAIVEEAHASLIQRLDVLAQSCKGLEKEATKAQIAAHIEQIVDLFINHNTAMLTTHIIHEAMVKPAIFRKIKEARAQVTTLLARIVYDDSPWDEKTLMARAGVYYSLLQGARLSLVFNPTQDMQTLKRETIEALMVLVRNEY